LIDGVIDDLFCEYDASMKGLESMPNPSVTFVPLPELNTFLCSPSYDAVPFLHEISQLGPAPIYKEPIVVPKTVVECYNKNWDRKLAAADDVTRKGDSYGPKTIGSLVFWKGSE